MGPWRRRVHRRRVKRVWRRVQYSTAIKRHLRASQRQAELVVESPEPLTQVVIDDVTTIANHPRHHHVKQGVLDVELKPADEPQARIVDEIDDVPIQEELQVPAVRPGPWAGTYVFHVPKEHITNVPQIQKDAFPVPSVVQDPVEATSTRIFDESVDGPIQMQRQVRSLTARKLKQNPKQRRFAKAFGP